MTPDRRRVILADIASAPCEHWLAGFVAGLRLQGEMSDADVALAVRDKCAAERWTFRVVNFGEDDE